MFRIKISPQAVVTIETALPKLIIALLLITFSYAIIGFLIDIMLVLLVLTASVFRPLLEEAGGGLLLDLFHTLFKLTGPSATVTLAIIPDFVEGAILLTTIGVIIMALLGAGIGAAGGAISTVWFGGVTAGAGAAVGAVGGGLLFALIFVIFLIVILVRCLWTLLKAFINVILATIFAPLIILVGALPGSNAINSWFRNLLANIAVMPVMFTMFLIASFFGLVGISQLVVRMEAASLALALTALGSLDFGQFFSLLFSLATQDLVFSIFPFVGLGILFLAPKTADIIQSFLAGKPFAYGAAIGETITAPPSMLFKYGVGALTAGTKIGEAWTTRLGLRRPPGAFKPPGRPPATRQEQEYQ
jgi:hypothetical protein